MIKITILASLWTLSLSASPDACIKERSDFVKNVIPAGYLNQINKILECDGVRILIAASKRLASDFSSHLLQPKFYSDCYEQNMGQKMPKDLNSVLELTCSEPDQNKAKVNVSYLI